MWVLAPENWEGGRDEEREKRREGIGKGEGMVVSFKYTRAKTAPCGDTISFSN